MYLLPSNAVELGAQSESIGLHNYFVGKSEVDHCLQCQG